MDVHGVATGRWFPSFDQLEERFLLAAAVDVPGRAPLGIAVLDRAAPGAWPSAITPTPSAMATAHPLTTGAEEDLVSAALAGRAQPASDHGELEPTADPDAALERVRATEQAQIGENSVRDGAQVSAMVPIIRGTRDSGSRQTREAPPAPAEPDRLVQSEAGAVLGTVTHAALVAINQGLPGSIEMWGEGHVAPVRGPVFRAWPGVPFAGPLEDRLTVPALLGALGLGTQPYAPAGSTKRPELPRAIALVAQHLPFDQAALEQAVDQMLDRLGNLGRRASAAPAEGGALVGSLGFAALISALELSRRLRAMRRTESDRDADDEETVLVRLPWAGLPGPWSPRTP